MCSHRSTPPPNALTDPHCPLVSAHLFIIQAALSTFTLTGNLTFPATFPNNHSGVVILNGQDHTQILFLTTFPTSTSTEKMGEGICIIYASGNIHLTVHGLCC